MQEGTCSHTLRRRRSVPCRRASSGGGGGGGGAHVLKVAAYRPRRTRSLGDCRLLTTSGSQLTVTADRCRSSPRTATSGGTLSLMGAPVNRGAPVTNGVFCHQWGHLSPVGASVTRGHLSPMGTLCHEWGHLSPGGTHHQRGHVDVLWCQRSTVSDMQRLQS